MQNTEKLYFWENICDSGTIFKDVFYLCFIYVLLDE